MKTKFESMEMLVDIASQDVPSMQIANFVNPEYCLDAPLILPRGSTLCAAAGPTHKSPTYSVTRYRRRFGSQTWAISRP